MINWIMGIVLFVLAALAVRYIYRQHKKGACAGGCAGCSQCGDAHCNCSSTPVKNK